MIADAPPFLARLKLSTVADFRQEWCWYADGVAVDLAGCSAIFSPRVVPTDAAPLFVITSTQTSAGLIELGTGVNAGLVALNVDHLAVALVTSPVAHGELLIQMSDGEVIEFARIDLRFTRGSTY